jgi:ABC-2 type transport system ATP-binding protein
MCDDICLFSKGNAVLQGDLREIKKSFGTNTVLLEFIGNPQFLDELKDVRINNRSNNFAEIRLLENTNAQTILSTAMKQVEIIRFECVQPSLQDIFISTVNEHDPKTA